MRAIEDCKLYVITGEQYHPGRPLGEVMESAIAGGADIVQLRVKSGSSAERLAKAKSLRALTRRHGVLFIVNDDAELAIAADADGVHLGQDDMPLSEARRRVGKGMLIGISTHELSQALEAERSGADYVGVGPVYPTATKPGRNAVTTSYVFEAAAQLRIPFFAIGGISPATADEVLAAGARRLCAVSAVVGHPDPVAVCVSLKRSIERWEARDARLINGWTTAVSVESEETMETAGTVETVEIAKPEAVLPPGAANADRKRIPLLLNGKQTWCEASTLGALAWSLGLAGRRVMAELNGEAVPRADWEAVSIRADDRVEFVQFVGGG
ncbi:thiamine-phosphate pyrophosphorylase [Cohnella sp. OV330]|uniref:thiamine phosphate synthase n=1 Tax=Cohnella sp. OV330 TaxID=1855288 RepID=UPI0008E4CEB3|nr:thiamine phosphate synthase [Cohnella sp. OV330]SFA89775.1 thiamine-phosphate pyrophosphorylase [Cohnella sp. OV330]